MITFALPLLLAATTSAVPRIDNSPVVTIPTNADYTT